MSQDQKLRYDGRVAVVTGAGGGLGREYALLFGSRGAKVVVNDLGGSFHGDGASKKAADLVVDEIRGMGGTAVADYNSVIDGEKVIATAIKNFGRIDILINNAGILRDRSIVKLNENDWNLVLDVHLKGSFKCTQAAWPYMKKQNYGRIIMTSSHSGIYGNFGQSNYSAAKMGLVGLANTIAVEGKRNNIFCNVIIPTAASRMTADILPEVFLKELKPHLIAPVVAYLCHETCQENGSYIDSSAGWAGKVHIVRGKGTFLRTSIEQDTITPEYVKKVWPKVVDMSDAKHIDSITDASSSLLQVLEDLEKGNANRTEVEFNFNSKDLILYALGVGASIKEPMDVKFLYENDADFSALPTFFIQPALLSIMATNPLEASTLFKDINYSRFVHGEQYMEIVGEIPKSGKITTTGKILDVMDKGSGTLIVYDYVSHDADGNLLVKNQISAFLLGSTNIVEKKQPHGDVVPIVPPPSRAPDCFVTFQTMKDQATLYRLSGDFNPLHIDPNFSIIAGYEEPILHGLCVLGFSTRAVLAKYANNDALLFKAIKARFASAVIPGQTLKVTMWKEDKRIHFVTSVIETGKNVITGAYVDLKETPKAKL